VCVCARAPTIPLRFCQHKFGVTSERLWLFHYPYYITICVSVILQRPLAEAIERNTMTGVTKLPASSSSCMVQQVHSTVH
jgi:hypothetical protein